MKINESLKKRIKMAALAELKKEESKRAVLITPYPLSQAQMTSFRATFPFLREKEIEEICDQKLIAGFILKWESKIIDASLAGRIDFLVGRSLIS